MVGAQRHRGPDDHGVEVVWPGGDGDGGVLLGSCRLAILDLSPAGRQPMSDPRTGNWIVHNGEIYNFRELRAELEARGESFRSESDTEAMLLSYKVWGRDAVERWRGMFACAIWDAARRELLLVRDRFGIKPLYWARGSEGEFLFASETRAILSSGLIEGRIDPDGVESFLAWGSVRGPGTILEEVRSLPPATCAAVSRSGELTVHAPYWDLARCPVGRAPDPEAAIKVRSSLLDAVESHLVSDAPLGLFLSGGVDSTAIAALMSRVAPDPVRTFSVVFEERKFDERAFSREVAAAWGCDHHEEALSEERSEVLIDEALEALDQPSIDGVNTYLVSHCARQGGVKVALSGLGGDEVFGGYSTFRRVPLLARAARVGQRLPRSARGAASRMLGALGGLSCVAGRLPELADARGGVLACYALARQLCPPAERRALTGREQKPAGSSAEDDRLMARLEELDAFHQVCLLELELYLGNTLLRDTDVMSMAHSLEVRVPFLDHRLVEHVWSLPTTETWRAHRPKRLLLEAMGRDLPVSVTRRPKMGFTFPWPRWIRGRLREGIEAAFRGLPAELAGIDGNERLRLWRAFLAGRHDRGWSRVWGLYVLARWEERLREQVRERRAQHWPSPALQSWIG